MPLDKLTAMSILDIDILNKKNLKKQYRKMALQYHPDKNGNSVDSTERFKLINESYDFLNNEVERNGEDEKENGEKHEPESEWTMDYSGLLSKFLESILKEEGKCYSVIKDIVLNGCKKLPLDKDQSMYVYLFLSKYKSILHISQETLELIKGVVMEKFEQDQVYIINPSLDDLLENNVYKHLKLNLLIKMFYHFPMVLIELNDTAI
jgi:hypothetical protein